MALVLGEQGALRIVKAILPFLAAQWVNLYVNDYTPLRTSRWIDFTQATFGGYQRQKLGKWGKPFFNAADDAETDGCLLTWTATGERLPQTVYGYYVSDDAGAYLWGERAATPIVVSAAGQVVTVQPIWTM